MTFLVDLKDICLPYLVFRVFGFKESQALHIVTHTDMCVFTYL